MEKANLSCLSGAFWTDGDDFADLDIWLLGPEEDGVPIVLKDWKI